MELMELTLSFDGGKVNTNADQLSKLVTEKLTKYNYVVTPDLIQVAKVDAAHLRKMAKRSKQERSNIKNKLLEEWKVPEATLMKMEKELEAAAQNLADAVKAFEDEEKEKKRLILEEEWKTIGRGQFVYELVHEDSWLNKSVGMDQIRREMKEKIKKLNESLDVIRRYGGSCEATIPVLEQFTKGMSMEQCFQTLDSFKEQEAKKRGAMQAQRTYKAIHGNNPDYDIIERRFIARGTKEQFRKLGMFITQIGMEIERTDQ